QIRPESSRARATTTASSGLPGRRGGRGRSSPDRRPPVVRLVGVRVLRASMATSIAAAIGAACTETPSSFPPCILDSPCPAAAVLDEGGGGDGGIAEGADDAMDGVATDASIEGSD